MLQVDHISYHHDAKFALKDINFTLQQGEQLAIIGESGSGKSTLLRLLYGELDLNAGHIFYKDKELLGPKFNLIPGPSFMKYLSQEFDLIPSLSVEKNIGEFLSNFYLEEKKARIEELLTVVELENLAKTKVKNLSGGQKQRVALARSLAKEPEVLLLDEPFSHIDNLKKQSLRRHLFNYLKEKKISCIVATHDKDDCISFADTMLVLHQGKMIAKDSPKNLYNNPKNPMVASFFDEYNEFQLSEIKNTSARGTHIVFPHELTLVEKSNLQATVKQSYFRGDHYLIEAAFKNRKIYFKNKSSIATNSQIYLEFTPAI